MPPNVTPFRARTKRWWTIRAQADDPDVTEVFLYDAIDSFFGISAGDFVRDLNEIDTPKILARINSPGGQIFDGIAIYNALRRHRAQVDVQVDGIAASIAAVIAMAGETITMLQGSQMMIHDAMGLAFGDADEMREQADFLDQQSDVIAGIFAKRTGVPITDVRDLMHDETWMTADEAVERGFADEADDGEPDEDAQAVAHFDLSLFNNVPEGLCDGGPSVRSCESALRDAGFTRSDAKAMAPSVFALRDAAPPTDCTEREARAAADLLATLKGMNDGNAD